MVDREKVIKGLDTCIRFGAGVQYDCTGCPYDTKELVTKCITKMQQDALELLVPFDVIPQIHTGSFLTKEQAEQFKEAFKDLTVVVRCKDCKHKVDSVDDYDYESKCPGYCSEDEYYSWVPDDDWFCANGERR